MRGDTARVYTSLYVIIPTFCVWRTFINFSRPDSIDDTVECAFATSKLLIVLAVISIKVTILLALASFWFLNYIGFFQNTTTFSLNRSQSMVFDKNGKKSIGKFFWKSTNDECKVSWNYVGFHKLLDLGFYCYNPMMMKVCQHSNSRLLHSHIHQKWDFL